MTVSICVVARNEEKYLPSLIEDIKGQIYSHAETEVVFVDSMSTDATKSIMQNFQNDNDFSKVVILDNEKVIQASGWNLAIKNSTGDIIIRIDAHSHVPSDFVQKNVLNIQAGENISGGIRPCINEKNDKWSKMLLNAENSLFGSSINESRHSDQKTYVKTMFHAAYKRQVFEKSGVFNENLKRTEDNELHYRMRKCGYRFCYDPNIKSYQYCRSSLKKMIKQKYGNGFWIGLTLGYSPKCLSIYHFIPFAFILGIVFTTTFAFLGFWYLALIMWGVYLLFALSNTVISATHEKGFNIFYVFMPLVFLLLHVSYGIGTLIGLLCIPFKLKRIREGNK